MAHVQGAAATLAAWLGAREALDLHFVFVLAVFVLSNVKEVLVVGDDVDADR